MNNVCTTEYTAMMLTLSMIPGFSDLTSAMCEAMRELEGAQGRTSADLHAVTPHGGLTLTVKADEDNQLVAFVLTSVWTLSDDGAWYQGCDYLPMPSVLALLSYLRAR